MTGILLSLLGGKVSAVPDPYFEYTTLLLPGNGTNGAQNNTFLDASTNNFTITRNGNTTQGNFSPFSQTGWGNYFNGTNAGLSVNVSGISAGTSTFTLEMWIYLVAYPSVDAPIVDTRTTNTATTTAFLFGVYSTGAIKFYDGTETNLGGTIPTNQWTHIALVRNASNVVTPYINGTATGTTVSCTRNLTDNAFWIASYPGPVATYLSAYLSNLRWVVGTAVYTSNFTPSTTPLTAITNTKLLTCQANRFVDSNTQTTPKTITVNGSPSVQAFSPFNPTASWSAATYGGSGYFDGNGDYLTAAQNTAFSLGTGAFTVEAFFYLTSFATTNRIIGLGDGANGGSPTVYTAWSLRVGSGTVDWYRYDGTETAYTATTTVNLNAWNHVVVCRDGSSNLAIFLNGVRVLSQASVTTSYNNVNTNPLYLGRNDDGAGGYSTKYITGYVSNPRIVKGSTVYSPTSTTLTVPTAPLTNITNTSLLLNFTNAGIYDATSKNDLETVGNAQISTTQSKWGGSSMAFDGTGDYLLTNVASADLYTFGTGNFTIEMWVYVNSLPGTDMVIYDGRPSNGAYPCIILQGSTNKIIWYVNTNIQITATSVVPTSTWFHLAISRSGTSTKMFVDGTQSGSTYNDSTNYLGSANRPYIGANATTGTQSFNGYIQDLRVTKGYARYTANFTAPASPFPLL